MTYKTQAIILRKKDLREYDRYYDLYTKDFGKIRCIARGVRKRESKLVGMLQEFAVLDVMIAKGKGLDYIAGVKIVKNFQNIKSNLDAMKMAYLPVEVVERSVQFQSKDKQTYDLLEEVLDYVNTQYSENSLEPMRYGLRKWILKLLKQNGYEPNVAACEHCGQDTELEYIDVNDSAVYCRKHAKRSAVHMNKEVYGLLKGEHVKAISAQALRNYIHIVDAYVQARLERGLHTVKVI